ncbi:hypothetical protein N7447_002230, partial [Penicillium robsamsonii]|uniref:uncharacterized protein n=1 Tax=Penicillium robsamsonii TaxID=1792511 RepID=UPI0025482EA5
MLITDLGKYDLILGPDVDRRDRLFREEEVVNKDYRHIREHQSGHWQVEEQRKMARNLNDEIKTMTPKIKDRNEMTLLIDISAVRGVGFNRLHEKGK